MRRSIRHLSRLGLVVTSLTIVTTGQGGCGTPAPAEPTPVEVARPPCPPGMIHVEGAQVELGEWDPERIAADEYSPEGFSSNEILLRHTVTIDAFCMDEYPFPGKAGDAWPSDGLSWQDAVLLDVTISRYDRRLCSIGELLFAAAGPDNMRYPYHPTQRREGACDRSGVIGSKPECRSALGFHDFLVDSTWGRLMDPAIRARCAQDVGGPRNLIGGGSYAVWGGNMFQDTFYAPSNFGIHFHSLHEGAYDDDGVRTCADPETWTEEGDEGWQAYTRGFRETGRFSVLLYGAEEPAPESKEP